MAPDMHALQDTNDRFLGNIQRNGTFSVVPRVAAGEILPEHLIVIGQIAKDYGLYTKIVRRSPRLLSLTSAQTGGQRLDLFGAQRAGAGQPDVALADCADLPAIWKRLNDAGMESGHAYGKSLRTVKVRCWFASSTDARSPASAPPGAATASATLWVSPFSSRTATRACARRTSSSASHGRSTWLTQAGAACPAAFASVPRRRARTLV